MSPRSSESERGFTLLDSLIAVAILAMALPLVFETVRSAVWRMSSIERRESYWRVADNLMTESVATLGRPFGIREGSTDILAWRIETAAARGDGPGDIAQPIEGELVRVRVTVRRRDNARYDDPVVLETLTLTGTFR